MNQTHAMKHLLITAMALSRTAGCGGEMEDHVVTMTRDLATIPAVHAATQRGNWEFVHAFRNTTYGAATSGVVIKAGEVPVVCVYARRNTRWYTCLHERYKPETAMEFIKEADRPLPGKSTSL